MVSFTCDGCNETLKKNQVDSHARKCRQCSSVSCIDCCVCFWGDDYKTHTSCITEAERYEKSFSQKTSQNNSSSNNNNNKGNTKRSPQEVWKEIITIASEKSPPSLQHYFHILNDYENVPRKAKAFQNFASNSLKLRGPKSNDIVTSLWDYLSSVREDHQNNRNSNSTTKNNNNNDDDTKRNSRNNIQEEKNADDTTVSTEQEQTPKKDQNSDIHHNDDEVPVVKEKETLLSMRSTKQIVKQMKKSLRKAPNKTLRVKALRKVVKEQLLLKKKTDEIGNLKILIRRHIKDLPKVFKMEGKSVILI
eukprot:CAMPEP_0184858570 /NCGR_PEP_ID=MMETSP0580-20130426/3650_1 /TAXON_ID=1118495 /ORGANISM="Dactyliosolen fragilissimus" /LENGTH=304 /DNA_ID=CAMNT_0027354787 /DNA_START=21 /DNA_END=935 /DNA_ORIENTATION=-